MKIEHTYRNNRFPTEIEISPFWSNEEAEFMKTLISDIKNNRWENVSLEKIEQGQQLLLTALKSVKNDVARADPGE